MSFSFFIFLHSHAISFAELLGKLALGLRFTRILSISIWGTAGCFFNSDNTGQRFPLLSFPGGGRLAFTPRGRCLLPFFLQRPLSSDLLLSRSEWVSLFRGSCCSLIWIWEKLSFSNYIKQMHPNCSNAAPQPIFVPSWLILHFAFLLLLLFFSCLQTRIFWHLLFVHHALISDVSDWFLMFCLCFSLSSWLHMLTAFQVFFGQNVLVSVSPFLWIWGGRWEMQMLFGPPWAKGLLLSFGMWKAGMVHRKTWSSMCRLDSGCQH